MLIMLYYKNALGQLYAFENDAPEEIIAASVEQYSLVPITTGEYDALIAPTPEQLLARQVAEAMRFLADTDFKMLLHYEPEAGDDMEALIAERAAKRQFIRDYYAA